MRMTIVESGMTFGPFDEGLCFHIEQSRIYEQLKNGLRMAEFLVLQPERNKLLVVEAKSSSPQPSSSEDFEQYITEVSEKLNHAWSLTASLFLERHVGSRDELPKGFVNIDFASLEVVLLLVVNGHREEWLPPLQDSFQRMISKISKIWIAKVVVMNEQIAMTHGLIEPPLASPDN